MSVTHLLFGLSVLSIQQVFVLMEPLSHLSPFCLAADIR